MEGIIVLLGSPNSDRGELLSVARDRCERAICEYHRHPGYAILPTGGFGAHFNSTDKPHAFYLKEYLLAHGVPEKDILAFAESRNTIQDAALSFPIAKEYGVDRAIVVTSDYHADRARYVFQRAYADIALLISACPTDARTCDLDLRALVAHEKEALAQLKRQEQSETSCDDKMADDVIAQVRIRASNPQTIHDMALGLSPTPQIHPRATPEQVAAAEAALGFALPPLLKRLYTEIGNGGFGPGYGLIGVCGERYDLQGESLTGVYQAFRAERPNSESAGWPEGVIPLCTWGCGIYSCLDCTRPEAPVLVYDPDAHVLDSSDTQATLIDADGEVVWTYTPEKEGPKAADQSDGEREIPLVLHKESFREWISAWACGVDLWEDMQELGW